MNIYKYSTSNLLKVTLIFGIVLSVVNFISIKTAVGFECATSATSNPKELLEEGKTFTDDTTQQQKELNELKIYLNGCFENIDSAIKTNQDSFNEKLNNNEKINKLLSKNDSLIFINLPIVAILLLLWFLNQKKQQKQIKELTKNQNKILGNFSQFNEINNKLNNLDRINCQIVEKIQDSEQKNIDLEIRLREFLSKQQFNQSVNYHNNSTSNTFDLSSIAVVDKISQLVGTYNQDKTSLSNKAIATVAETQESLNQRRSGSSDIVTLENTPQKKYCVIEEDNDHYLIPHAKIKIDEYNRTTLESLFDCTNFTSEYSYFQLVKPAKVSQIDSETWQLEEKGKLDFY